MKMKASITGPPRSEKRTDSLQVLVKAEARSPRRGFVPQWLERLISNRKTLFRSPVERRCVFSSDPAVSSSIFVGEKSMEFD